MTDRKFVAAITLCLALLFPMALSARPLSDIEEEMDRIRLDETTVYGEGFGDDRDMAYNNALTDFLLSANDIRGGRGLAALAISDIQPVVKDMEVLQGDLFTVMVYLPTDKMMAIVPGKTPGQVTGFVPGRPTQQSGQASQQQASQQSSSSTGQSSAPVGQPSYPSYADNDIIAVISGQDNWSEIKGFMTSYKNIGRIKETGVCYSAAEVPADACSLLIDEYYGVLAYLSPKNSSPRINYRTNQPDSESNYSNCKIIVWYR